MTEVELMEKREIATWVRAVPAWQKGTSDAAVALAGIDGRCDRIAKSEGQRKGEHKQCLAHDVEERADEGQRVDVCAQCQVNMSWRPRAVDSPGS